MDMPRKASHLSSEKFSLNGEIVRFTLIPAVFYAENRVGVTIEARELGVVTPAMLDKFKLPLKVGIETNEM